MEIERKFLVSKLPAALEKFQKLNIRQGYISHSPTIRIRKQNSEYILAMKSKGSLSREEYEMFISEEEFNALWHKTEGYAIEKERYLIPIGNGLTAELDIFQQKFKGMVTVEVEFESEEQANNFIPPCWFGADVTYIKEYKNGYMSKNGPQK